MKLSDELISKFVKITNDEPQKKNETVVYATAKGSDSVQIDGSDTVIKVDNQSAIRMKENDRVTVMIKNHTAVATGNLTDTSGIGNAVDGKADNKSLEELKGEHNTIVNSVNANTADIGTLKTNIAKVGDLSAVKATVEYIDANKANIDQIESVITKTGLLEADIAEIDKLTADLLNADEAIIEDLVVERGRIDELEAEDVRVNGRIDANEANIKKLVAADATINELIANKADIAELTAVKGDINTLTSDVAEIDTLIFGSASGSTIQTSFANAVIAQLGDAQIKSAMIESVSAEKITAGDIITNNVQVKSKDGNLTISDETLQISDGTRVRVQIGKDASNDYSINIWDQNGNLMFSKGGITDSAIKDAIIRNDMVSENANIHASKLNIDSLFEEINDSSKTIKATKVELDETGQKLDVAFTELTTDLSDLGETVSSQGTAISVLQGQVSSKIWQQDINAAKNDVAEDFESDITSLSTRYSDIKQTVDNISTTISDQATEISKKADSTTVTTVSNKVSSLEQNVNGFKTEVSSTYATKNEIDTIKVGGRNFIIGSKDLNGTGSTNYNGKSVLDNGFTAFVCTGDWHGVSYDAKNLILNSKAGDEFTYSVNIKTSNTCKLSFFAMCYTSSSQRVYPELTTGQFNNKVIITTNSEEEQDQRAYITFQVTQGWVDLINDGGSVKWTLQVHEGASSDNPAYLYAPKLECGNKPTDWSPAPEDMATAIEVEEVMSSAELANERINETKSLIEVLSESISMLVTDGSGASLMKQTEDGWTFSTGDIQNLVDTTSENLDLLTKEVGDVENTVDVLQQAVSDLGNIAEYVKIGTYENEPCIELGEGDSDFKLRITNTRMVFTEGPNVLAYFNNQSLHIKKAVVEDEFQQGGFIWKVRSNGNLGLTWKGGNS